MPPILERTPNVALFADDQKDPVRLRTETRRVQIKAAIYPSEKAIFERACALDGASVSDVIREYLIQVAARHGLTVVPLRGAVKGVEMMGTDITGLELGAGIGGLEP